MKCPESNKILVATEGRLPRSEAIQPRHCLELELGNSSTLTGLLFFKTVPHAPDPASFQVQALEA
eukprot:286213-Rhodomonas_salina.2